MQVRGAPLIGAAAAYGMALAAHADPGRCGAAAKRGLGCWRAGRPRSICAGRWTRWPWYCDSLPPERRAEAAWRRAAEIADDDVATCSAMGDHGLTLIERAWQAKGRQGPVNVLTHCNAGWLAAVDWGTALAPVYKAHDSGIPLHVWADETRPRNQGASLTAWELGHHGVPHTVIVDNAGGHLMQRGLVDLCIVGSDRTTRHGDVCNKIGTYLKALAARDCGIPFYVALPGSTIDWTLADGIAEIPIEERDPGEVTRITGLAADGREVEVVLTPAGSPARNDAFDVTPARLVTALITERGTCPASEAGLRALYPEEPERLAGADYCRDGGCLSGRSEVEAHVLQHVMPAGTSGIGSGGCGQTFMSDDDAGAAVLEVEEIHGHQRVLDARLAFRRSPGEHQLVRVDLDELA